MLTILDEQGDYLKMYAIYCSNQGAAREMLDKCMKKDKAFAEFIHHANLNQRNHRLTLRDYLIKPVQRICKYPLLLRVRSRLPPGEHASPMLTLFLLCRSCSRTPRTTTRTSRS